MMAIIIPLIVIVTVLIVVVLVVNHRRPINILLSIAEAVCAITVLRLDRSAIAIIVATVIVIVVVVNVVVATGNTSAASEITANVNSSRHTSCGTAASTATVW